MTSNDTLLPCPFCGGEARISRAHQNKMLAMGEVATDEHYLFTLHHTCNPALNDGVTICWAYKPKAALIAAWNRRTPPTPATDEREAVARAYQAGAEAVHKAWVDTGGNCPGEPDFWEAAHDYADAHPFVAAEILAAEANERARIVAWLGEQYCLNDDCRLDMIAAIKRNEHGAGK